MRGNVRQAGASFHVTDMERALRFYCDGLGAVRTKEWAPEGRIGWCWIELGEEAVMLQEGMPGRATVCFFCEDAVAERPFRGNGLWVTTVIDLDGYRLDFESPTEEAEETVYGG